MTRTEAQNLHAGDQIKWNDPDNGECSRVLTIKSIQHQNEFMIIIDSNGNELQCYADELE